MPKSWRTLLACEATALLLTLCLLPKSWFPSGEGGPKAIPHFDKLIHFGMFANFAVCWERAGRSLVPTRSRAAAVLAAAFALAVGTELAQGLPQIQRDPDPIDALADAAGALAGVGLVASWGARRGKRDKKG